VQQLEGRLPALEGTISSCRLAGRTTRDPQASGQPGCPAHSSSMPSTARCGSGRRARSSLEDSDLDGNAALRGGASSPTRRTDH